MTTVRTNANRLILPYRADHGGVGLNSFTAYSLLAGDPTDAKKLAFLGTGNAGQTITGVAGLAPVWTDTDRVSAFQQLSNQTISAGATNISVNNLTGWDEYRISVQQLDTSNAATLQLRMSINNGSSYLGGTNYGYSAWGDGTPLTGATLQPQIVLNAAGNLSSNAGYNDSILIRLFNLSAGHCGVMWKIKYGTNTTGIFVEGGGDLTGNADVVNAIRLILSAGSFDGAIVTAWGLMT